MNKYKYLLKNVGLLTVSSFGSKLLSFFLVPLYTSILTTAEYGTFDLITTTISLLIPVLTVNIIDSALRFALDKESDKQEVFSIALKIIGKGTIFFALITILNYIFNILPAINSYIFYFILSYFVTLLFQLLQSFSRGIEKIFDLAVSGIINSVVLLSLNVLFLVYFRWGLVGYFLSNIIGHLIALIYLALRIRIWKFIRVRRLSDNTEKEMLSYSRPLIINSISWWINNASDRYVVTWMCGVAANGIYSVGYKIPSILTVIQTIFNQAWQISSVDAYDSEDSHGFFKNVYSIYNIMMVFSCSVMIVLTRFIAHYLYAKDFFAAWRYVPFLMISIIFGALSGVLGGVFQAVKDSKIQSISTAVGAILNIVMNIIFVYFMGPIGAAIATAISYAIVWILRLHHVKRYITININLFRDFFAYFILIIQTVLMLIFGDSIALYSMQIACSIIIAVLYKTEILQIIRKFVRKETL